MPEDKLNDCLKWSKPVESELKEFLINQKGFSIEKVNNGISKLNKFQPGLGKT